MMPADSLSLSEMGRAIVEAPAQADARRFQSLVEAHFDTVWRTLRALGVLPHAVDDAAQQVFVIALNKIDSIRMGSERSFLVGTAVGVAANARRIAGRKREVADCEAIALELDPSPNPEEHAVLRERQQLLESVLRELPDELRTVFVLFELEGLTTPEIAATLNLASGTVASRLRRAREQFRTLVSRIESRRSE